MRGSRNRSLESLLGALGSWIIPPVPSTSTRAHVTPESAALRTRLLDLLQGYRATCVIVAAIELGVLEHLRAGPASAQALADQLGAHYSSLQRFLRALEVVGVVELLANGAALPSMD